MLRRLHPFDRPLECETNFMKFPALCLALTFGAATLFGQEAAAPKPGDGPIVAQAPAGGKDSAVTAINDRGVKEKPAPASSTSASGSGDTTTIPARSAGGSVPAPR